jgi:hypothetical protein
MAAYGGEGRRESRWRGSSLQSCARLAGLRRAQSSKVQVTTCAGAASATRLADVESTVELGSRHGRLESPVKCYFKKVKTSSRGHHSRTTCSAARRMLMTGTSTDRKLIIHRAEVTVPNNVLKHLGASNAAATDAVLAHRTLASAGSSPANLCPARAAVPVVVLRVDAVAAATRLARRTARVGLAYPGDTVRTRRALGWLGPPVYSPCCHTSRSARYRYWCWCNPCCRYSVRVGSGRTAHQCTVRAGSGRPSWGTGVSAAVAALTSMPHPPQLVWLVSRSAQYHTSGL